MNVVTILDPADPRLTDYRGVSDAVLLRERELFVAEGRLVVERVLASRRFGVSSLLLNRSSLEALRPALESVAAPDSPISVFLCETSMFSALTGYNIHRGCLALVRRPSAADFRQLVANSRLLVVLESVTNPDNVGSVFRNAKAFGVDAVLLSPTTCDPLYRKAIRTSMGAALAVPFARLRPWPESLAALKMSGFTLAALSPREPSMTLDEFAVAHRGERIALLIGTEGQGLSQSAESDSHARVRIPMQPGVDSLNLAVATGIALSRLSNEPNGPSVESGLSHDRTSRW